MDRNRVEAEIENWQIRAEGCGSMLLLLPCNSSRRRVVDKSKRQKRMLFIIQRDGVFILVYRGAVMEAW
jgi:hypothetical protein